MKKLLALALLLISPVVALAQNTGLYVIPQQSTTSGANAGALQGIPINTNLPGVNSCLAYDGTQWSPSQSCGSGTGSGSVSLVTSNNLAPLFTVTIANPTSLPAFTFSLSAAPANSVFGNCTNALGVPSYCSLVGAMIPPINLTTSTNGGVTGNLQIANFNSGSGATSSTFWRGDGTWAAASGSGSAITVNGGSVLSSPVNFQNGTPVNGLTINAGVPSGSNVGYQLSGTLTDAGLTSSYSGIGNCAIHQFANVFTRNAQPGCAQPVLGDINGGTAAALTFDYTAATLKVPNASGYTPLVSAVFGYDTTANRYTGGASGTNEIFPWFITTPVSGQCLIWSGTLGLVTSQSCSAGSVVASTINAAAYYTGTATIGGSAAPTGPNGVPEVLVSTPSGSTSVAPIFALSGINNNSITGASYSVQSTDCGNRIPLTGSSSVAITLPLPATLAVPKCIIRIGNYTTGTATTVTITPSGGNTIGPLQQTSYKIPKNQYITITVNGSNWDVDAGNGAIPNYFRASDYAGASTDISVPINACLLDAEAVGGVCDSRMLTGAQIQLHQINLGSDSGTPPVDLLVPAQAVWNVDGITNGTDCALYQSGNTSIVSDNPGGAPSMLWNSVSGSANLYAFYCTSTTNGIYTKAQAVKFRNTGHITASGATCLWRGSFDNSSWTDIACYTTQDTYAGEATSWCCGSEMIRPNMNCVSSAGCTPFYLHATGVGANKQDGIRISSPSFDHPGPGFNNLLVDDAGGENSSAEIDDLYAEMNQTTDTTTACVQITGFGHISFHDPKCKQYVAGSTAPGFNIASSPYVNFSIDGFSYGFSGSQKTAVINNYSSGDCTTPPCTILTDAHGTLQHYANGTSYFGQVTLEGSEMDSVGTNAFRINTTTGTGTGAFEVGPTFGTSPLFVLNPNAGTNPTATFSMDANTAMSLVINAGLSATQNANIQFEDQTTIKWQVQKTSSNTLQIFDQANSIARMSFPDVANAFTNFNSVGTGGETFDSGTNSGTGSTCKYSGGASPAIVACLSSLGEISGNHMNQIASNHWAGVCTLGTNCTLTFPTAFNSTPVCVVSDQTGQHPAQPTPSTTGLSIGGTGTDVIAWACFGNPN